MQRVARPFLGLVLFVLAACSDAQNGAFGLRTVDLNVGGVPLKVEVADTQESLSNGLMYRSALPDGQGMLFILGPAQQASFWMKNTKIPLSIGYIDGNAILREEHDMQPFDERTIRSASKEICYALEVNQGWFQKHHIDFGIKITGIPR
ncbi:MAG TPA: DUF192 domain-containing protein [Chthoniobacterales bacterium]|nr:DUF192 domain-containing protein [Chthoniobacterales bacterium]